MIFVLCGVVIVAGLALAFWIGREGERSYARHQEAVRRSELEAQMERLTKAFAEVRITLVDNLTPALQKAGASMRRLADSLAKGGER